jgi:lipopolysaccharide transport system ATP-binding protein
VTDVAIRAEGLGKIYRVGERQAYGTLRETLVSVARAPIRGAKRRLSGAPRAEQDWMWALRDLSFELEEGEVLGVIGRNGAGKSTLLKILSRITEPTEGEAHVTGRVGALLEVGTGFHPELTGRENVALNGAILGMRKREIARKFDEIVEFAGVERYIDTPVKRYSSGMHTRLAFAVAAHLEPDILIVDEVLAVGDAEFQKKCMGKMGEVARGGRTVLFVSHNMTAVEGLCDRAIWLDRGRPVAEGRPPDIVSRYLSTAFDPLSERTWEFDEAPGDDRVRLRSARVRPESGTPEEALDVQTPFVLEFEYWNLRPDTRLNVSLHVYNEHGIMVFNAVPTQERAWQGRPFPKGLFRDTCHIPGELLNDGVYTVELLLVEDATTILLEAQDVLVFEVRDVVEGRAGSFDRWAGVVRPTLQWETEHLVADGTLLADRG